MLKFLMFINSSIVFILNLKRKYRFSTLIEGDDPFFSVITRDVVEITNVETKTKTEGQ